MKTVSWQELQEQLPEFVQRLHQGEAFVIRDGERDLAEVRPLTAKGRRPSGLRRGDFEVPEDFDAPLPDEILEQFEGR